MPPRNCATQKADKATPTTNLADQDKSLAKVTPTLMPPRSGAPQKADKGTPTANITPQRADQDNSTAKVTPISMLPKKLCTSKSRQSNANNKSCRSRQINSKSDPNFNATKQLCT